MDSCSHYNDDDDDNDDNGDDDDDECIHRNYIPPLLFII